MSIYFECIEVPRISGLGGGTWKLHNLNDVTVIFGRNGSGKSVLLRAIRDHDPTNHHYVTPERTGEIDFQPNYMSIELDPIERKNVSLGNFVSEYRRRIVARIQTYFMCRGNYRGQKITPDSPKKIENYMNILLTDFALTLNATDKLPYKLIRADNDEIINDIKLLSSGEAQLVTLGLDILTMASMWQLNSQDRGIILIDEPDVHIHPDLQVRFADFLNQIISDFKLQIIVATHSTSLLAALGQFGGESTSVIYLQRNQVNCNAQKFDSVKKELSACLGGHVLMGFLFGSPILLVEGDDDYRIWSQVPRYNIIDFAVIPSNGDEIKNYQKSLERIFASLRENDDVPCGYALRDNDVSIPKPNPDNPQKHIRYIQMACHEAENLYLSDEVLKDIGITWDDACSKILEEAPNYGQKKDLLETVPSFDRNEIKSADIKEIINEIAKIIDDKQLHWTHRVGKVLGKEKPLGQIAEFLGEDVVNNLWKENQ